MSSAHHKNPSIQHCHSQRSNLNSIKFLSQTYTSSDSILKKTFTTFKDPASRPICEKNDLFYKNLTDLPETRLKLFINQKVLKNDEEALMRISSKLAEEEREELKRQQNLTEFRNNLLTAGQNRKLQMQTLQNRCGLETLNLRKNQSWTVTARINSLAQPKSIKRGFAEDYIDSCGLLKAGILEGGKSVMPKSARIPGSKICSPFPFPSGNEVKSFTLGKRFEIQGKEVYSQKEIRECMKDINDFHDRIGKGKGKVGFPQIFLEKYKKGN